MFVNCGDANYPFQMRLWCAILLWDGCVQLTSYQPTVEQQTQIQALQRLQIGGGLGSMAAKNEEAAVLLVVCTLRGADGHRIIEAFRLEKTTKIIQSNL